MSKDISGPAFTKAINDTIEQIRERSKHIVLQASTVLTATYSFATETAGSPGFYEGKAILHFGQRQIATVAHARGGERAIAMALIAAAQEALLAFPAGFSDGDGDAD